MSELRIRYFATLGLNAEKPRLEAALDRAYQLRSFEIEHYWKRGTYFWGFQVAIFAAFGLLWKDGATESSHWHPVTVGLAALGFITALANRLSALGSRFWQRNWEKHIDMLEDEITGRLYKTVWLDNGAIGFSVSRINEGLSCAFIGFWALVFIYAAWTAIGAPFLGLLTSASLYVPFIFISTLLLSVWLYLQKTELKGTIPKINGDHDAALQKPSTIDYYLRGRILKSNVLALVRRYAPDEGPIK